MPFPLLYVIGVIAVRVVIAVAPVVIKVVLPKVLPKVLPQVAKQIPKVVKQVPKAAKGAPKRPNTPVNKYKDKAKKKEKKKKDPCADHNKNRKKRKYVVYKADEYDKAGKKIGTYVGRTSGAPGESTGAILRRRQSGHHRNVGPLQRVFETDSYPAVRGAEQVYRDKHSTSTQINPIGPKNKRKDDYMNCADSKGAK